MFVVKTSVTVFTFLSKKNVERHIAKRIEKFKKKKKKKITYPLGLRFTIIIFFFSSVFSNKQKKKKFIHNEPTLNTLLLTFTLQRSILLFRCDFPKNLIEILNGCWVKRNVERRCIRNAKYVHVVPRILCKNETGENDEGTAWMVFAA